MNKTTDDARATILELLGKAGITMEAAHVPSGYDPKSKEFQGIKWRIKFSSPRGHFETDYTEGIGHLPAPIYTPKMAGRITIYELERLNYTLKTGHLARGEHFLTNGPALETPSITDVVGCLMSDRSAADCASFEEWAQELGYDVDSRKAESIYHACLKIALDLNRVFGASVVEKIAPLASEL